MEDFEDRLLDLALEIGGDGRIWRSAATGKPERLVRGIYLDIAPGQETTSLLIAPEGWLISLMEIEEAEEGTIGEPPWCFVKTQFVSVEGHIFLVELLAAIKKEFIPDLEVHDEGDYWETRDVQRLREQFGRLNSAIAGMRDGLQNHGLTAEAAEDPDIVVARIQRIAEQVHKLIARPSEHAPVQFEDPPDGIEFGLFEPEAKWDASHAEHRRKQERMHRSMEEQMLGGTDHNEAFEQGLRDQGIFNIPEDLVEDSTLDESDRLPYDELPFANAPIEDALLADGDPDEPWRESLDDEAEEDDEDPFRERDRHTLQEASMDLMLRLHDLFKDVEEDGRGGFLDVLLRNTDEIMGGLAQALSSRGEDADDDITSGLMLVQLKRARRGAALARAVLIPLKVEDFLSEAAYNELDPMIAQIESGIIEELREVRTKRGDE